MPGVFSVQFDHAQRRMAFDRLPLVAIGEDFEQSNPFATTSSAETDHWVDPVTKRTIIKPYCLYKAWYTSGTGDNAKLAKSDFGLGSNWEDRADQQAAGNWIGVIDASVTSGRSGVSTTTYAKNQGFYLAWFVYGSGETYISVECGWNNTATGASGVSLRILSDGSVEVWKDNVMVQTGKIGGPKGGSEGSNQFRSVMLLPWHHSELLVYSPSSGDGFSVVFEDIAEDDADPTITSATKFWINCPSGAVQLQVAPLKFPTSAVFWSKKLSFIEPPATGEALAQFISGDWYGTTQYYRAYGYPAYVGAQYVDAGPVTWSGSTFTPDGSQKEARVRVALSTNNQAYTPSFEGVQLAYPQQTALTDDADVFDATNYVLAATLSVPASAESVGLDLDLATIETIESEIPGISTATYKPVRAGIGEMVIFDGIASQPRRNLTAYDESSTIQIACRDKWALLENYIFTERYPLDGLALKTVIEFLGRRAGLETSAINITDSGFIIPREAGAEAGDFGSMIEPGDNAAQWFKRLVETYAPNWYYGFRPRGGDEPELFALSEDDLGSAPLLTVYLDEDDARGEGLGTDWLDRQRFKARTWSSQILEPFANDIRVTGWNPRTRRPRQAHWSDADSQRVDTPVTERPSNWLGTVRRFVMVDPSITTSAVLNSVVDELVIDMTVAREAAEMDSDLLMHDDGYPLWRGDPIHVRRKGIYRIEAFSCGFQLEDTPEDEGVDTINWRNATYTLKKVANE